jgi:hypothetical protein
MPNGLSKSRIVNYPDRTEACISILVRINYKPAGGEAQWELPVRRDIAALQ